MQTMRPKNETSTVICDSREVSAQIVSHTDALEPGLGAFPGCREGLVLGRSATHPDLDGGRHERAVAESGRRVVAGGG